MLKQTARRGVDRVIMPYVEEVVARVGAQVAGMAARSAADPAPAVATPPPAELLHNALHTARTIALSAMPSVPGTLLSAGPNGKWYFDWFDSAYGHVARHIAVEAYTPQPDDLPGHVEWVKADISSPEGIGGVRDGEVDLLFSGQNIEHLWPDQVVKFLLESSRVVRPGGWLVVDSPNRHITAAYRWSMAEHTLEFTASEAQRLLELAGFDVRTMRGLWLCRRDGALLPLEPVALTGLDTLDRLAVAGRRPDDSFIWWAEAVKVGEPREDELRTAVDEIYRAQWGERVSRLQVVDGTVVDDSGLITIAKGTTGYPVRGPYLPLRDGRYRFTLPVSWEGCQEVGTTVATLELVIDDECTSSVPVTAGSPSGAEVVTFEVDVHGPAFGSHVRLLCTGSASIHMPVDLVIEPEPWRVADPQSATS